MRVVPDAGQTRNIGSCQCVCDDVDDDDGDVNLAGHPARTHALANKRRPSDFSYTPETNQTGQTWLSVTGTGYRAKTARRREVAQSGDADGENG